MIHTVVSSVRKAASRDASEITQRVIRVREYRTSRVGVYHLFILDISYEAI